MARISTFDDAMSAIWQRSGYDRGFISNPFAGDDAARLGLIRTQLMLDRLDNPEQTCKVIHVAGSKGKGSTCMFLDTILGASGLRSGRFLSPHLHSFRERFAVAGALVPQAEFTTLTRDTLTIAESIERESPPLGQVTAFELSTAMALLWFARASCDTAIIEVGLGGTLDATNVVLPAVSVITSLDFEHTEILGPTMNDIAGNKAGIIKHGCPVVSAAQPPDALAVIRQRANECGSTLLIAEHDWWTSGTEDAFESIGPWGTLANLRISLVGQHQVANASLAIATADTLRRHDVTFAAISDDAIRTGLAETVHPGRFEQITLDSGQVVVLDGAHSQGSATVLSDTMRARYPGNEATIVIGMFQDKDAASFLSPLLELSDRWIAVSPESPRAMPAGVICSLVEQAGNQCTIASSTSQGLHEARESESPVILVTGSLTTVAEARKALGLSMTSGWRGRTKADHG